MSDLKIWKDFEKSQMWQDIKADLERDLDIQRSETRRLLQDHLIAPSETTKGNLQRSLNNEAIYEGFLNLIRLKINKLAAETMSNESEQSEIVDIEEEFKEARNS